jgi:hypothetical protein
MMRWKDSGIFARPDVVLSTTELKVLIPTLAETTKTRSKTRKPRKKGMTQSPLTPTE